MSYGYKRQIWGPAMRDSRGNEWVANVLIIGIAITPIAIAIGTLYIAFHFVIKFW